MGFGGLGSLGGWVVTANCLKMSLKVFYPLPDHAAARLVIIQNHAFENRILSMAFTKIAIVSEKWARVSSLSCGAGSWAIIRACPNGVRLLCRLWGETPHTLHTNVYIFKLTPPFGLSTSSIDSTKWKDWLFYLPRSGKVMQKCRSKINNK